MKMFLYFLLFSIFFISLCPHLFNVLIYYFIYSSLYFLILYLFLCLFLFLFPHLVIYLFAISFVPLYIYWFVFSFFYRFILFFWHSYDSIINNLVFPILIQVCPAPAPARTNFSSKQLPVVPSASHGSCQTRLSISCVIAQAMCVWFYKAKWQKYLNTLNK